MRSNPTQEALSQNDLEAVESHWLAHLGESPTDLPYFVEVSEALVAQGAGELSQVLLELLHEELKERSLWSHRLEFLRQAGKQVLEPAKVHAAVLDTLRQAYREHPNLEDFIEIVGLLRGTPGEPKMWTKVSRLESLLAFDVGTIVAMEGKGVGRVVEINLALESLKIDFESYSGVMVGFRAAGKLLQALAPTHILRRKLEAPETLRALVAEDPPELLRITLTSYDQPLAAGEVRKALVGLIPEKKWTSWWGAARKHPQVVASTGSRQTYRWVESEEHAHEALWQAFTDADPRQQLDLLKRAASRDPALRQKMTEALQELVEDTAPHDLGLAFEVWSGVSKVVGGPPETGWTPRQGLEELKDVAGFVSAVRSRTAREEAYALLRQSRQSWPADYRAALLVEEDPRLLEFLARALAADAPRDHQQFLTQTLSQPQKAPAAFTWLAERAAEDEELRQRLGYRLLRQILASLGNDVLARFRARLTVLCDSGGTVPRILSQLTEDQAKETLDLIHRAGQLEGYQREQLANAIHLRFPNLQEEGEHPLYATAQALEAKRAELKELMEVEIPANRRAIEEARALGDLRENFEYKSARQRHEYLSARASALHNDLARVEVLDPSRVDPSQVRVGTRVGLADSQGSARELVILGPWESQPEEGIVSYESDLAQEILGKEVGDVVRVSDQDLKILSIEVYG